MAIETSTSASYSLIASEYYNAALHPTCANLREASAAILGPWLGALFGERPGLLLETGCGASLCAEIRGELGLDFDLILSDQSAQMLGQSSLQRIRDSRLLTNAEQLALKSRSVDAVVASLGDPYNTRSYWRECARVLKKGGKVLFTTPASVWARTYRGETGAPMMAAEFDLAMGRKVWVPSYVLTESAQRELVESAGFRLDGVVHKDPGEIRLTTPSPKLRGCALASGYSAILK